MPRRLASEPGRLRPRCRELARGPCRPRPGCPSAGERVAVLGCGTSCYMAQAYAALRESAGQGETDAWAASEFPAGRRYDRVVALTRSGTTTEVLDALRRCGGRRADAGDHRRRRPPVDAAADTVCAGLRRRAVGRADPLRDHRAGPAAHAPGRGHRPAAPTPAARAPRAARRRRSTPRSSRSSARAGRSASRTRRR